MPTLSEALADEYPREFELASSWASQIGSVDAQQTMFAEAEADVVSLGARRVLGFGLTAIDPLPVRDERVVPAVVVQITGPLIIRVLPAEQVQVIGPRAAAEAELGSLQRIRARVAERVDIDPDGLVVIAVPAPREQLAPGDEAHCGFGRASFGARVMSANGVRAILTAGHAAPAVNAGAYDAGANLVGTVTASVDCRSVSAGVATADVATIELQGYVQDTPAPGPVASRLGTARMWDTVIAYGSVTSGKPAQLLWAGNSFAGPSSALGAYGEAAMTAHPISAPGDSGSPVYSHHGELVGHVVAGYTGVYSVIQDATYQLNAAHVTLR